MANPINRALARLGLELRRLRPRPHSELVSLTTEGPRKGAALVAYIVAPFLLQPGQKPSQAHTHHTESLLMARAFLELGYDVDVIDYRNGSFRPTRRYDFFISARTHFTEIAQRLPSSCIKIAHLDTAHFVFNNAAAYQRLLDLQRRRGVTVPSIRVIEHNFAPENADCLTVLGNEFDEGTYRYAGKPIFRLLVPTPNVYPDATDKDLDRCRNRFLWFGSTGFVHKGLDLVLEAFSGLPDHHLTVCGPVDDPNESVFRNAFHRELYTTPNIHTHGWVDVSGPDFLRITRDCVALIYPSCAEANCGSVITCLQAGLIPIISHESGVDVADFGVTLEQCSPDAIREQIIAVSSLPNPVLREMSGKAQDYARVSHTTDAYLTRFKTILRAIEDGLPA
jgi:glycosyltransferase involved in cell wall biosynthesis